MTELLVGTKKGLFVLEGEPGSPFEVTARAFAGDPVEYALRDTRSGRVLASVTSPFYGPKIFYTDDVAGEWQEAAGVSLPGPDAALERIWVIVTAEADGALYAGGDPGVLFESRDGGESWELNRALWKHPTRRKWQPGAGGLCLHSISTWPGEPDRLAVGISAAGVWLTDDGGATWRSGNTGIVPRYLPEGVPEDEIGLCVHRLQRAPTQPERIFMQFHGGVYRSDDAGESWNDIAPGLPSDFGFPLALDPADAASAYVIPLNADTTASRPRAACACTRRATRARAGLRAATASRPTTPTSRSSARRSTGSARAPPSSSTSARPRAPSSDQAMLGRAGSRWRRASRPSTRSPLRRDSAGVDRDLDGEGRSAAGGRVELEVTVEGVDAVAETAQAAARRRVGTADAVVADPQAEAVVLD